MNERTRIIATVTALVAAAGLTVGAQAQQGNVPGNRGGNAQASGQNGQAAPSGRSQSQQQAPEGFVLFEDNIVYLMANEPQNHFVQAVADLRQKDNHKAAAEINIAASYIDGLSSSEKNQDNQSPSLSDCGKQLRDIAKQVRDGKISNADQLSQDFARANATLARHFQQQAEQSLKSNKQVRAAYALDNAASSYKAALAWSNQAPNQQSTQAIADANWTASQLMGPSEQQNVQNEQESPQSGKATAQKPEQVSQELASQIDKFEKQLAQGSGQHNPSGSNMQNTGNASGR